MTKKPLVIGYLTSDYHREQTITVHLEDTDAARGEFLERFNALLLDPQILYYYVVHEIKKDG